MEHSSESIVAYQSRALGSSVDVVVTDPRAYATAVAICQAELTRIDMLASRFRPDSELRGLELHSGRPVRVSDGLFDALTVALSAADATDGAVDPTVGNALCRLGYDRDFADIAAGVEGEIPEGRPVAGWRSIEMDERRRIVRVPTGVRLDIGATAKALAADRIAQEVHRVCRCGIVVSLGGDVATAGEPPIGGFRIGIEGNFVSVGAPITVAIQSGGIATSGITGRRWLFGDEEVHHLINPSSGLPVETPWRTVTVSASTCVEANVASTGAMVMGANAVHWIESHGLHGRLVTANGTVLLAGGWPSDADTLTMGFPVRC